MTTGASETLGRLEKALDTCLRDQLRVIADYHEEAGDLYLARAYRWLADNRKHPWDFSTSDEVVFTWWFEPYHFKNKPRHPRSLPAGYPEITRGWSFDAHCLSDAYRQAAVHMVKIFKMEEKEACTSSKTAASGRSSRRGQGGTRKRTRAAST